MSNIYTQIATPIHWDTKLKGQVRTKNLDTITFDSFSEFGIWQLLYAANIPCAVHSYNNHLRWYIDFTIKINKAIKPKLDKLLDLGYTPYHNMLFIEYKGVLDDKTIHRYSLLPKHLKNALVVVTDTTKVLTPSPNLRKTVCKPLLRKVLQCQN